MNIVIRRVEPSDYKAISQVNTGSKVVWGTLQLPFPSEEIWRKLLERYIWRNLQIGGLRQG